MLTEDEQNMQDALTEKGWREAELLSERLIKMDIKNFYVSPLRRGKETASLTLNKLSRPAEKCQWLRELGDKFFQRGSSGQWGKS